MLVRSVTSHLIGVAKGMNWALLEVETDAGVVGWGECTLEGRDLSVLAAVDELSRSLIGTRADEIELHWNRWYRMAIWRGAALFTAMSGLEQALWDIRGKELGQPVGSLLGGPVRKTINAFTWPSPSSDPSELAEHAIEAAGRYGFTVFKLDPFDGAFTINRAELARAESRVAALATAVHGCRVAIDGHERFRVPAALTVIEAFGDYRPMFFEELVSSSEPTSMRRLRAATAAPLSAGEKTFLRWGALPLLQEPLVDYLQLDVCHAGGILESRKIAAMAEAFGLQVLPHNPNGPAGFAATLQLAACTPNVTAIETVQHRFTLLQALLETPFEIADGQVTIPTRPGLGIEINRDALREHRSTAADLPFTDDGAVQLGRL